MITASQIIRNQKLNEYAKAVPKVKSVVETRLDTQAHHQNFDKKSHHEHGKKFSDILKEALKN